MVFKNVCLLVYWTKVALALEGLRGVVYHNLMNISALNIFHEMPLSVRCHQNSGISLAGHHGRNVSRTQVPERAWKRHNSLRRIPHDELLKDSCAAPSRGRCDQLVVTCEMTAQDGERRDHDRMCDSGCLGDQTSRKSVHCSRQVPDNSCEYLEK